MDKQMQEAPQSFRGRMFRQDQARPKEQRILVLKTGIAGAEFYIETKEERIALNSIQPGTELMLFREPKNPYDQWAVAVYLTENDKVGYLTRYKNESIARLMDAGKKFIAVVDEDEHDSNEIESEEKSQIRTNHAPTENYSLPFAVYLVEEM